MRRRSFLFFSCLSILLVLGSGYVLADEKTSASDRGLAWILERFPEADADGNGVLTEAEADAFRRKAAEKAAEEARRRRGRRPPPDHADVKYGSHERNVLDFWKAPSEKPTPVVVYIHGGGFVGGSKRGVSVVNDCLATGISVAAIHYRFVTTHPFPAPQRDGARAIQFLRHKATDWNIDPKRIAAYGGSAGAGISMWLAFHDDLADPDSDDPIERKSSRIVAAGSFGGQSSYDPHWIKRHIGGIAHLHGSMLKCYGISSAEELDHPRLQALFDECSAITHLTKDDAPVFMFYSEPDAPLPENARPGQGIHHPIFAHRLKGAMDALGIENVYHHRSKFRGNAHRAMLAFFRKQFARVAVPVTAGG